MSVKFNESTQCYDFFYVATAIVTVVYSQKVITDVDQFQQIGTSTKSTELP